MYSKSCLLSEKSTVKRSLRGTTTDGATLLAKHVAVSMREDAICILMMRC